MSRRKATRRKRLWTFAWTYPPAAGEPEFFFFQAEDGIRDYKVTGVQTCALPICPHPVDGRPGATRLVHFGGVHQRQGEISRDQELREEAVAAAELRILPRERAHKGRALFASEIIEHRGVPFDVALVHRELFLPSRLQQILPAPGGFG